MVSITIITEGSAFCDMKENISLIVAVLPFVDKI
jgi:hypothetical protein